MYKIHLLEYVWCVCRVPCACLCSLYRLMLVSVGLGFSEVQGYYLVQQLSKKLQKNDGRAFFSLIHTKGVEITTGVTEYCMDVV